MVWEVSATRSAARRLLCVRRKGNKPVTHDSAKIRNLSDDQRVALLEAESDLLTDQRYAPLPGDRFRCSDTGVVCEVYAVVTKGTKRFVKYWTARRWGGKHGERADLATRKKKKTIGAWREWAMRPSVSWAGRGDARVPIRPSLFSN